MAIERDPFRQPGQTQPALRRRSRRKHAITPSPALGTKYSASTMDDRSVDEVITDFIRTHGALGANVFECERGTHLLHQTISPALSKLRKQGVLGYVLRADGSVLRRKTGSGRTAAVYALIDRSTVGAPDKDAPVFGVTAPAQRGKHGPRLPDPDGVHQPRYAAKRVMPDTRGIPLIHRIHRFVRGRGKRGATYEECGYALEIIQQTVTPALRNLYKRGDVVVIREQGDKYRQRLTTAGTKAAVYVDKSYHLHDPDLFTGAVDAEYQPSHTDVQIGPSDMAHWGAANEYDRHSSLYVANIGGKFCIWSILTDSPIAYFCDSLEELFRQDTRARELPEIYLDYIIEYNRAGIDDETLSIAQILHQYRKRDAANG